MSCYIALDSNRAFVSLYTLVEDIDVSIVVIGQANEAMRRLTHV